MEMAEKSTERVRRGTEKNMERRKEQNRKAAAKYTEKLIAQDPEGYAEYNRVTSRESMKKRYHEKRAAMTEEELAAERERNRLRMKAYREKKKAEKLALEAAAKAAEENKGTV